MGAWMLRAQGTRKACLRQIDAATVDYWMGPIEPTDEDRESFDAAKRLARNLIEKFDESRVGRPVVGDVLFEFEIDIKGGEGFITHVLFAPRTIATA